MPQVIVSEVEAALVSSVREQLAALEQRAQQEKAILFARLNVVFKAHGIPEGTTADFVPTPTGSLELRWKAAPPSSPIPLTRKRRR